ncbi:MAG: membrane protein insertase YidC [Bacteroidia bacterium]|nr:membrane protein insertase YidC [Bacteroidia bacterium]
MDRNSITGLILITLLSFGYFYFFNKSQQDQRTRLREQQASQPQAVDTLKTQPDSPAQAAPAESDSARIARQRDRYSDLYLLTQGQGAIVSVKTDQLTVELNTQGGGIHAIFLNEYRTFDSLPLPVYTPDMRNQWFFDFPFNNRAIRSSDLFFTPSVASLEVHGADTAVLVMRAAIDDARSIEQVYTFTAKGYDFGYQIRMNGLREALGAGGSFDVQWKSYLPQTEQSLEAMHQKTAIVYQVGDDVERLDIKNDTDKKKLGALVNWISYKSQFFSQILIADKPLRSATISQYTPQNLPGVNRVMDSRLIVDAPAQDQVVAGFRMYAGPNEYYTLNSYKLNLEESMDLGWWIIGYINKGTTYIFKFLEGLTHNYGLIIIIMAILIRLVMFPLSIRSYVSMAKMRILNASDEMKQLDEKYKDDMQKLQVAKMAMYKETNVSMFGGCLPMLISYPFLISFFFFFPQSVELRQQSFLWAHDLSTFDSILALPFDIPGYGQHVSLFCLLMSLSTFVYTWYQQKSQPQTPANAQFKYVAYMMPFVLLIFLNKYAAGLSLYYLMSNVLTIGQNAVTKLFISDEKLLAEMKVNQKKYRAEAARTGSAPKSRMEKWMDEQQKKQQEAMKQQRQGNGTNRQTRRKS